MLLPNPPRAYYVILHPAKAALHVRDIAAESHRTVRRMFGLHLVKTREIEPLELTKKLEWLPSERGLVTILRKFSPLVLYDLETPSFEPVAHPLLVYAELIFQGRERELETAKILYDKYLSLLVSDNGP